VLAARSRVRRRPEFTAVMRGGRRAGAQRLVVHLLAAPERSTTAPPRAGFIVGRSVGPAVVRNRVRRRLRHLVAALLADLPAGSLLVVRALPAAATSSFAALGDDLDRALRRARQPTPGRAAHPPRPGR
jgi:ribonuclease P protein component